MKNLKNKYDKKLDKYHLSYHHLKQKAEDQFRYDYLYALNQTEDLCIILDTQYGSTNKPDPKTYTKDIESYLMEINFRYNIRFFTVPGKKGLFSFLSSKGPMQDQYSIIFILPKSKFTKEVYQKLFCEYDTQIGYKFKTDINALINSHVKGYVNNTDNEEYFEENLFDSRLFKKLFSTEDMLKLI